MCIVVLVDGEDTAVMLVVTTEHTAVMLCNMHTLYIIKSQVTVKFIPIE